MGEIEHWAFAENTSIVATLSVSAIAFIVLAVCEHVSPHRDAAATRLKRWAVNLGLGIINQGIVFALPISAILVSAFAAQHGVGVLNIVSAPLWVSIVLGFVLRSAINYGRHRICHQIPWLWRAHRIHHTDEVIDVSTTARIHPLDAGFGILFSGLGVFLFGIPVAAIILYGAVSYVISLFHHANIQLSEKLERRLQWIIITPILHQLHHSNIQCETNSNFSSDLVIWDRMFGTFREKSACVNDAIDHGLDEWHGREAMSLMRLLTNPFRTF